MRSGLARRLAWGALLTAMGTGALAHVRLHNPSNGNVLFWQNPGSIGIVVQADGSDDLPGGSHLTALRNAIDEWNAVELSSARLVEDASPESQARTDWEADDIHLVLFDEDNASGFFPPGSGTVAITPVWFFSNGRISDADVLFNGKGFHFTTQSEGTGFDVQDVATHELGHLLGLDHSGWAGGTMYPFVDPTVILHRSLSLDEIAGLRDAYPSAAQGVIRGRILRAEDASPVAGAHVVARDAKGRTAGGTLAGPDGDYELRGLLPGSYQLYATPLDEPVSASNLTSGHEVDIDFMSTLYPHLVALPGGAATVDAGDLYVEGDVDLNLGRSFDRYPRRVISGLSSWIIIRGTGLLPGSTLESSDPAVEVIPLDWVGFQVNFEVAVPVGAAPGHIDLVVTNAQGEISILPAALEITPPSPTVSSVTPAVGGLSGGTSVTVEGTGFRPGCRVVLGDQIYVEGEEGCERVDSGELRLVTRPTPEGLRDLVVIDPTGVEGRADDAFRFAAVPRVDAVFPGVGFLGGGTSLVLAGADFLPGARVRIGGVEQPEVTYLGESELEVVTGPGAAGGPFSVEVENPGGFTHALPSAFSFVDQDDVVVSSLEPDRGPSQGGATVLVRGENFPPDTKILFGADPMSGAGGVEAPQVLWIDEQTLSVVTPSWAPGPVPLLAVVPETGQTTLVPEAYTYEAPPSKGGCFGATAPGADPGAPEAAWIACLAGAALLVARRAGARLGRAA